MKDWLWAVAFGVAFFAVCVGFGMALGGAMH